jgi:hypothetical protein
MGVQLSIHQGAKIHFEVLTPSNAIKSPKEARILCTLLQLIGCTIQHRNRA